MGCIYDKERVELQPPQGWSPENEQCNLPFLVEITPESGVHIHWQDIRLEMDIDDFEEYYQAIKKSYRYWRSKGKPRKGYLRIGWWPGEEGFDRKKDRRKTINKNGKPCHHFRKFPRTESGKKLYDGKTFQIELQAPGQLHIHYRNWRWELGVETFLKVADLFTKYSQKIRRLKEDPNTRKKFKYWKE